MTRSILMLGSLNNTMRFLLGLLFMAILGNAQASATSFIAPLPKEKQTQQKKLPTNQPAKTLNEYWGLSYHFFNLDGSEISFGSPKSLAVKLGRHFSKSLSLEFGLAVPIKDDNATWNGLTTKVKVNALASLQLRKGVFNFKGIETYGLFGFDYSNLSTAVIQNSNLTQATKDYFDIAYGVGIRSRLGNSNMVGRVEYNRWLSQAHMGLSSLSLGVDYYF